MLPLVLDAATHWCPVSPPTVPSQPSPLYPLRQHIPFGPHHAQGPCWLPQPLQHPAPSFWTPGSDINFNINISSLFTPVCGPILVWQEVASTRYPDRLIFSFWALTTVQVLQGCLVHDLGKLATSHLFALRLGVGVVDRAPVNPVVALALLLPARVGIVTSVRAVRWADIG